MGELEVKNCKFRFIGLDLLGLVGPLGVEITIAMPTAMDPITKRVPTEAH